MSTYIEFNVLKQLNDDFLKNIKIISVFGHKVSEVLIVTKDDTVFAFGQNDWGVLGFGHNRQVFEPKIVEELSGKGIIKFVNGLYHVIGLTNDGKIYSWGRNDCSQLGNGMRTDDCNKPEINEYLIYEVIVDISCGNWHSLVLTEKKELFVWGCNNFGQIGNESEVVFQLKPIKLKEFINKNVIAISCGSYHSLVLTDEGNAFSWGSNDCGQLENEENDEIYNMFRTKVFKNNKPKLIKVKNYDKNEVKIEKICCGCNHSMLLSSDGDIYTFGNNKLGQIGNNTNVDPVKYKDIASHFRYNISIAVSVNNILNIWGQFGKYVTTIPKETKFELIDDIFLDFFQITHKSTRIPISVFDSQGIENKSTDNTSIDDNIIQNCHNLSLLFSPNIIAKYKKQTDNIIANFDKNMKISFHFYDRDSKWSYDLLGINAFFVTEESEAQAIGNNSTGLIGFSHKNEIYKPVIVTELCDKGIIDFANGISHVIARTDKHQLYIWGYNRFGELGNNTCDDCFMPQLIEKLSDECIVDICCGSWHSLALTETGAVYAWGNNQFGQIGNDSVNTRQLTPSKIHKFDDEKVIAISCGHYHSMALTESGQAFSWGDNSYGQLAFMKTRGLNEPKRIKFNNKNKMEIKKISCGYNYSLLLTRDGDIYGFGSNSFGQLANEYFVNHFNPTQIMNKNKFIEIASHRDCYLSAALTVDRIYYIWGCCGQQIITEPISTQLDSFNSIFFKYFQITYKRTKTDTKCDTEDKIKYERNFQEIGLISCGNYGIVSKSKNLNDNEICAIKRIPLKAKNKDSVFKEFEIMSKLNCDFVVKVKRFWIEDNYILKKDIEQFKDSGIDSLSGHRLFNPQNNSLLHIQMELCFNSMKEIIKVINNKFNTNYENSITQIHYYILCELLIEIFECVDYLHKLNPPIIHRDLKPANILITHGIDGRFVKLCDFGFAKLHEYDGQLHSFKGTFKYMAPEVLNAQKYNTKADIYSIAVVIQDFTKDFKPEKLIIEKYENLSALVVLMMKEQENRPNCETILNEKNLWALSISDIENDIQLEEISDKSWSIEDNFPFFFIKKKLEISKQSKHRESETNSYIRFNVQFGNPIFLRPRVSASDQQFKD